jgi:hypothetical protein
MLRVRGRSRRQVSGLATLRLDGRALLPVARLPARRIVETRGHVLDEDVRSARSAGLSDANIAEVVGHVALNTFTNDFNKVARTEIDFPRVRPTGPAPAGAAGSAAIV